MHNSNEHVWLVEKHGMAENNDFYVLHVYFVFYHQIIVYANLRPDMSILKDQGWFQHRLEKQEFIKDCYTNNSFAKFNWSVDVIMVNK